jgi:hypothetical protein
LADSRASAMANLFTSVRDPESEPVAMSNGLTAVVFDLIAIVGAARAQSEWEQAVVLWLVEHDQTRIGLGMAGFDVAELGWTVSGLAEQRDFLVGVLEAAATGEGWDRLPFTPGDHVAPKLRALARLVARFPVDAIATPDEHAWQPRGLPSAGTCEVHGAYLHELGCIVCNDAPIDATPAERPHSTEHR